MDKTRRPILGSRRAAALDCQSTSGRYARRFRRRHIRFIKKTIDPRTFAAILTINGSEVISGGKEVMRMQLHRACPGSDPRSHFFAPDLRQIDTMNRRPVSREIFQRQCSTV